jgi:uncharacterized protein
VEFNVAQLLKSVVGTSREYDVDEPLDTIDEFEAASPVQGQVRLLRTNRGVFVDARLGASVKLVCGRCLGEAIEPVQIRVREEFLPTIDIDTGLPTSEETDEETGLIDEHHILSLDDAFRQYALLELPIRPLCRPDCAGLCPRCGKNLNEGPCDCPPEPVEESLEPLAVLLRDLEVEDARHDGDS